MRIPTFDLAGRTVGLGALVGVPAAVVLVTAVGLGTSALPWFELEALGEVVADAGPGLFGSVAGMAGLGAAGGLVLWTLGGERVVVPVFKATIVPLVFGLLALGFVILAGATGGGPDGGYATAIGYDVALVGAFGVVAGTGLAFAADPRPLVT